MHSCRSHHVTSLLLLGSLLVVGVYLLLLVEALLVLLVGELLDALDLDELAVQDPAVEADELGVLAGDALLLGQQLLYDVILADHLQHHCILLIELLLRLDQMVEHFGHLLCHKGDRPGEHVHEVGQVVGMLILQELLDV